MEVAAQAPTSAPQTGLRLARSLMEAFARDSGLEGGAPPRRYLWTDAFAVGNFLGLYRESGLGVDLDRALRLVDEVHHVLGRHRPDDGRSGWISGLADAEGERHPTRGGLRIGKRLPERRPGEPFDARLEWDRDGQYFHYLTQWMHALARLAEETGQEIFRSWAVELAATAHAHFVRSESRASRRMVWKMSIDLRRVLVPSTGQHDPLDAWVAYLELRAGGGATSTAAAPAPRPLDQEIDEAKSLCADGQWATDDALGIGALLVAIYRVGRLRARPGRGASLGLDEARLLDHLVAAVEISLDAFPFADSLGLGAAGRLAFRELGLAIGLHAIDRLAAAPAIDAGTRAAVAPLRRYLEMAERIDAFWSEPANRRSGAWRAHADINSVMLATSLAPGGYLGTI